MTDQSIPISSTILDPVPAPPVLPPPRPTINLYSIVDAIYAFVGIQNADLSDATVRMIRALIAGVLLTVLDYTYGLAAGTGPHGWAPLGTALLIGLTTGLGKFIRDRFEHDLLF